MKDLIGGTNLYPVKSLSEAAGCQVYIKADYLNPGMSSKDRPALFMIKEGVRKGFIHSGTTIVEASSGNTAIGLAMICKSYDLKAHFFVSNKCSSEKLEILNLYGADVTICSSSGDMNDSESTLGKAKRFSDSEPKAFFCNQYFNEANANAHFNTTGPEIWEQTGGKVTHFIAGVGTGGTISGVGGFLKSQMASTKVIGADPEGSILYNHFYDLDYQNLPEVVNFIEGIGRRFIPGSLNFDVIDSLVKVSNEEAICEAYAFLDSDSFISGFSSAAVLSAFRKVTPSLKESDHVVLFFADHGSRYLSKLYNTEWLKTNFGHLPLTTGHMFSPAGHLPVGLESLG